MGCAVTHCAATPIVLEKYLVMELFYSTDIAAGICTLNEEESRHCAKVLRHVAGDIINVIDGEGTLYTCRIMESGRHVVCSIEGMQEGFGTHNYRLTMAVSPTKNIDRYEWFLEKATEMGVDVIVPVIGEYSERKIIKPERLEKILVSAAKQSLKGAIPKLREAVSVKEFISNIQDTCNQPGSSFGAGQGKDLSCLSNQSGSSCGAGQGGPAYVESSSTADTLTNKNSVEDSGLTGGGKSGTGISNTAMSGTEMSCTEMLSTQMSCTEISGGEMSCTEMSCTEMSCAEISGGEMSCSEMLSTEMSESVFSVGGIKLIAYCGEQKKITLADAVAQAKALAMSHGQVCGTVPGIGDIKGFACGAVPEITILIGPEGDFSSSEVEAAVAAGFTPLTLGDSRLRTETAAVAAVAGVYFMM